MASHKLLTLQFSDSYKKKITSVSGCYEDRFFLAEDSSDDTLPFN